MGNGGLTDYAERTGEMDGLIELVSSVPVIRGVLGFLLVFLVPGFAWTLVFFRGKRISILERLALSFGLSVAIVTLSVLALNFVFGVGITGFNAVLIILIVTGVALVIYFLKRVLPGRGSGAE